MKTLIITLLCLVALMACTNSPKENELISEALKKEAQSAAQNFIDAMARNDTAAIFAAFSENPEGIYSYGGEFLKIVDMMPTIHQILGSRSKQTFENFTDHYFFLNPTIFIYDFTCLNKEFEKSGVVTIIDPASGSYTFQKEKEGWKIVHMHQTAMNVQVDSSMFKK